MGLTILFVFSLSLFSFYSQTHGATFEVRNSGFTVWSATSPGGGLQVNHNEVWTFNENPGRIWARTNRNFGGSGRCHTGDFGGLLQCQGYGAPPSTLAEYALNQFNNLDFFDISLVDGFNVGMDFNPTSNGCTRGIRCNADINGQCPNELRALGGCNINQQRRHQRAVPERIEGFQRLQQSVHRLRRQRVPLHRPEQQLWPDRLL